MAVTCAYLNGIVLKPDHDLLKSMPTVSTWVKGQSYQPAAVNTFFQVADYYLVAHALAHKRRFPRRENR